MFDFEALRFPGDQPAVRPGGVNYGSDSQFFEYDLLVSAALTPRIANCFERVCSRLGLDPQDYLLFVRASPLIQAECTGSANAKCVVRVTSGLVQSFDGEELCFVIGHELGHFLLGHLGQGLPMKSFEDMALSRSRELSADRIGLLAAGALDAALSAMIKTVSGLGSEHLRFDVSAFLSQISKARGEGLDASLTTHPSFLIRARALLWFSSAGIDVGRALDAKAIANADRQVQRDIDRYVEGPAQAQFEALWEDFSFWFAAAQIVRRGQFSKRHQNCLNQFGGRERVEKLKTLLWGTTKDEAMHMVANRLAEAEQPLATMWPKRFADRRCELATLLEPAFDEGTT